jgi:hypothetical protein
LKAKHRSNQTQQRIAYEAARIMVDQGLQDPMLASRKAAARLGVADTRKLPAPPLVEQALEEYRRLFGGPGHHRQLHQMRETAVEAMRALERFQPRLTGPVLQGSADSRSPIQLHLFADTPEEVIFALLEMGIPWEQREHTHRYRDGSRKTYPSFHFRAGDTKIELVVFPPSGLHQAPLAPSEQRLLERARLGQVMALLGED